SSTLAPADCDAPIIEARFCCNPDTRTGTPSISRVPANDRRSDCPNCNKPVRKRTAEAHLPISEALALSPERTLLPSTAHLSATLRRLHCVSTNCRPSQSDGNL